MNSGFGGWTHLYQLLHPVWVHYTHIYTWFVCPEWTHVSREDRRRHARVPKKYLSRVWRWRCQILRNLFSLLRSDAGLSKYLIKYDQIQSQCMIIHSCEVSAQLCRFRLTSGKNIPSVRGRWAAHVCPVYQCFCAVLVREVDYCLCNMTAHVQSFSAHTLSSVNTVNAFNRHELVVSAHWQTALSAVKSKKIELFAEILLWHLQEMYKCWSKAFTTYMTALFY